MNYSLLFEEENRLISVIIIVQYFPTPDKSRAMSTDMKIVKNSSPPEILNAQPVDITIINLKKDGSLAASP